MPGTPTRPRLTPTVAAWLETVGAANRTATLHALLVLGAAVAELDIQPLLAEVPRLRAQPLAEGIHRALNRVQTQRPLALAGDGTPVAPGVPLSAALATALTQLHAVMSAVPPMPPAPPAILVAADPPPEDASSLREAFTAAHTIDAELRADAPEDRGSPIGGTAEPARPARPRPGHRRARTHGAPHAPAPAPPPTREPDPLPDIITIGFPV